MPWHAGTFSDTGGSVADVVPFMHVGGWPGDPSWGSISSVLVRAAPLRLQLLVWYSCSRLCSLLQPYTVWKGGDDALVSEYYVSARKNVNFFIREAATDGLIEFGFYGDWLSLAKIDKPQVTPTAQIMATSHLVEMAMHLGKKGEAMEYNASLAKMKAAYHTKYWDASAKSCKHGAIPSRFVTSGRLLIGHVFARQGWGADGQPDAFDP